MRARVAVAILCLCAGFNTREERIPKKVLFGWHGTKMRYERVRKDLKKCSY